MYDPKWSCIPKGKDVYIIGSGHSLKDNIEDLKKIREKDTSTLFIIADSVFKYCIDNGLEFDYVITSEGLPYLTYFDGYE